MNENQCARGEHAPPESRILRPVRKRQDWPNRAGGQRPVRRVIVLDTETTGLDAVRHDLIEISAAIVLVNNAGRIVAIEQLKSGLVDPGYPLPPHIAQLTGLSDADLAGRSIDQDQLVDYLESADAIIAFNAGFDRPFVEKLVPALRLLPWGCAMKDVAWRKLGFEPGPQGYLLNQIGRFMPKAHRAADDVLALIELLDHVGSDGTSIMTKLLSAIDESAWRFEAKGAPYRFRQDLRDRNYRWAPGGLHKVWHKLVRYDDFDHEVAWYEEVIGQRPQIVPLPATQRYRAEQTWRPA